MTNAGPAVARDVDVTLTLSTDESELGRAIDATDVAPALLRGEQRVVTVVLPCNEARFDDPGRSLEIVASYYDDNGLRNAAPAARDGSSQSPLPTSLLPTSTSTITSGCVGISRRRTLVTTALRGDSSSMMPPNAGQNAPSSRRSSRLSWSWIRVVTRAGAG